MPVSINCRSCRGAKKYWGVGMMRQYDCETCKGTGFEEITEKNDENKQEVIAGISTEAKEVKKAVVKKAAITTKSTLKKKATKKIVKKAVK